MRPCIPEDRNVYNRRCENLKPYKSGTFSANVTNYLTKSMKQCNSVNNETVSITPSLHNMGWPQTAIIRCLSYAKTVPQKENVHFFHFLASLKGREGVIKLVELLTELYCI
jgi:hypothetical protein